MAQKYFDGHELKKGKFTTPLNQLENLELSSWYYKRLPEYLWIGLILDCFERTTALEHCGKILIKLHELSAEIELPQITQILALDTETQKEFFEYVITVVGVEPLTPLNLIHTTTKYPVFASLFSKNILNHTEISLQLKSVIKKCYDHQSNEATDIRFLIIYFMLISERLNVPQNIVDDIRRYPYTDHTDEYMKRLRPTIRSMEGGLDIAGIKLNDAPEPSLNTEKYIKYFWETINGMYECELTYMNFTDSKPDTDSFMRHAGLQLQFYSDILAATKVNDEKMLVLVGIAAYAFKRMKELVNHELFHTISGRTITRCIIECYIMMKYLCKEESSKPNIWADYQDYGLGQYKLIYTRIKEDNTDMSDTHLNIELMKLYVNQRRDDNFIDMDTSYFDKQGIREKSQAVSEKQLWSHYYDYDSAFEHGLWGAIRESVMLDCNSVAHQYHFVPDTEDRVQLKSVWLDCKTTMTKILVFLGDIYGYPEVFPSYGGDV